MILLGIFDFYHFDELIVVSSTDWWSIIATGTISGLVAFGTVNLTIKYQNRNDSKKEATLNYDSRVAIIELNKRINTSMCLFIRRLKKAKRLLVFGAIKPVTVDSFNLIDFKYIDNLDIEKLFSIVRDLEFSKSEVRLMMKYKATISNVNIDMNNYHEYLRGICDDIMNTRKETDLFLTSLSQNLQSFLYKHHRVQVELYPSVWFNDLLVAKDERKNALMRLVKEIDNEIIIYQREVKFKNIRLIQLQFFKKLLAIARKYQKYNLLDVSLAQGFQTAMSMIDVERNRYKDGGNLISTFINSLNQNRESILSFSRLLNSKHQKTPLNGILKNLSVWF